MVVLAHVSDVHLDGGRAAERAARVVAHVDGLATGVDAVVMTGDLTDHGSAGEYEELRALLGDRQPVLTCPGDHDVRAAYRTVLLGEPAADRPIDRVHELPGLRVTMCDSTIPGRDDGSLADETSAWLGEVLAADPGSPTVVAFLHPPVRLHHRFADGVRQHGVDRLEALLLEHPQVVAVLCGHAHTGAASTFAGRPVLVGPGVVSTLRLPWESDIEVDIDLQAPPALAFHVVDEDRRVTTTTGWCREGLCHGREPASPLVRVDGGHPGVRLTVLAAFALTVPPLSVTPGVSFALVTSRVMSGGRAEGFRVAAGTACGLYVHATLAAVGLAALVMASSRAFTALLGTLHAVVLVFLSVLSHLVSAAATILRAASWRIAMQRNTGAVLVLLGARSATANLTNRTPRRQLPRPGVGPGRAGRVVRPGRTRGLRW